ncbi:MAG: segregation and condensation protein A [Bacteroidota bacterium]
MDTAKQQNDPIAIAPGPVSSIEYIDDRGYEIHLENFEGPFDLLLFFIQRDELDIHDIPISRITKDFLAYVHTAKRLQINLAAEFIAVAAQLMKIKARMLIPRPVVNEEGEVVDPRTELVDRLLEYKRFKEATAELEQLEAEQEKRFPRGYVKQESDELMGDTTPEDELTGLTLYRLLQVYKRILERNSARLGDPKHVIRAYPYSPQAVKADLLRAVNTEARPSFMSIVMEQPNRVYLVFCFLTLLELVQQNYIRIILGEGYNNFWLEKREDSPEAEAAPAS